MSLSISGVPNCETKPHDSTSTVTGLYGCVVFWTESLSVQKRSRVELATCGVSKDIALGNFVFKDCD